VALDIDSVELDKNIGEGLADKLRTDLELIDGVYPEFNVDDYLKADIAPVFFGSALNNFGVQELLDCFVEIAPYPQPVHAEERMVKPEEEKFTGFIFKITRMIQEVGSNGIADIIWADESRLKMNDKSSDGKLSYGTLLKLKTL
jgi:Peptide chain release factor RF-3